MRLFASALTAARNAGSASTRRYCSLPSASIAGNALTVAAGWVGPYNAGRVQSGTLAFLWEGQERVLPGAQSVLIEFPAISPLEAPDAPDPAQRQEGTVAEARAGELLWLVRVEAREVGRLVPRRDRLEAACLVTPVQIVGPAADLGALEAARVAVEMANLLKAVAG